MSKELKILLALAVVVLSIGIGGAYYYQQATEKPIKDAPDISETLIRPDSPTLGPADAKVTIVEFLDPECESCAAFAPAVKRVMKEFDEQVRLVIRYMPFHKNSRLAAAYLEAAGEQGKYWEMQDKMFENQDEWGEIHGPGPQPVRPDPQILFDKWAKELGLDLDQLKASVPDKKHLEKVERDFADGKSLGVRGTPTFYVNGRRLTRLSEPDLKQMVAAELKK
jgi:protein-disulfide isomerase